MLISDNLYTFRTFCIFPFLGGLYAYFNMCYLCHKNLTKKRKIYTI